MKPSHPQRRWLVLFLGVALLVLAQVSWWATLFLREVNSMADLKTKHLVLLEKVGAPDHPSDIQSRDQIKNEAYHRRLMFLSESIFFGFMACFGLFLIYQSLRAEARSQEIQKTFVEIVSHESKTPLTALKLRLESIREKRIDDSGLSHEIGLMLDEVRRLNSTLDKVLNWNRLERQALHKEVLDIGELVLETLKRIEPFLKAKGVVVSVRAEEPVLCHVDGQAFSTALQCLFENAALYNNRDDKRLEIEVSGNSSLGQVTIRDNGPGIEPEDEPHLFERFFRGSQGKKSPGTGLGLNIARSLVLAQGGQLKFIRPSGGGAQFDIVFPTSRTG